MTRILVPTDLSNASLSALVVAQRLTTGALFSEVLVLYVDDRLPPQSATFAPSPQSFDESVLAEQHGIEEDAATWMRGHIDFSPDVHYRLMVAFGDAVRGIVDCAAEAGADMIVMASRGRSGLPLRFLGSVAQRVLEQAPCEVVLVRR